MLQRFIKLWRRRQKPEPQAEKPKTRADMTQVSQEFSKALVANWEYYANGVIDLDEWTRRATQLAKHYPPALPELREKLLREEGIIQ